MPFKIGVDVGGTFIDLVVIEEGQNRQLYKTLSNPEDLAGAVIEGLNLAAVSKRMTLSEIKDINAAPRFIECNLGPIIHKHGMGARN